MKYHLLTTDLTPEIKFFLTYEQNKSLFMQERKENTNYMEFLFNHLIDINKSKSLYIDSISQENKDSFKKYLNYHYSEKKSDKKNFKFLKDNLNSDKSFNIEFKEIFQMLNLKFLRSIEKEFKNRFYIFSMDVTDSSGNKKEFYIVYANKNLKMDKKFKNDKKDLNILMNIMLKEKRELNTYKRKTYLIESKEEVIEFIIDQIKNKNSKMIDMSTYMLGYMGMDRGVFFSMEEYESDETKILRDRIFENREWEIKDKRTSFLNRLELVGYDFLNQRVEIPEKEFKEYKINSSFS